MFEIGEVSYMCWKRTSDFWSKITLRALWRKGQNYQAAKKPNWSAIKKEQTTGQNSQRKHSLEDDHEEIRDFRPKIRQTLQQSPKNMEIKQEAHKGNFE